ncbi:DUF1493 family protein [Salmonella enterica]
MVDCLLTNLHQPKTTHMVLTGQFAGVDLLYLFKKKELTPSTDLDSDLRLEDDEALAFNVDRGNFSITTYYPPEPPLKHLLNPFRKNDIPQVPDFTIGMLIASARAGRWLYD